MFQQGKHTNLKITFHYRAINHNMYFLFFLSGPPLFSNLLFVLLLIPLSSKQSNYAMYITSTVFKTTERCLTIFLLTKPQWQCRLTKRRRSGQPYIVYVFPRSARSGYYGRYPPPPLNTHTHTNRIFNSFAILKYIFSKYTHRDIREILVKIQYY